MTDQVAGRHESVSSYRIAPSPLIGCLVVVADIIVVFGLQLTSGIPYAEWTSTPNNTLRAAVIPLVAGSVLLVAFLAYARWDMVWRDPARLPLTIVMKVAMAFFVLAIVVRLVGIDWGSAGIALVLLVLATGVLVGFAEEILFRGIFLRTMRTGGRTEARAALWTAVAFGLFHLPNAFIGIGALQLVQVAIAAITGVTLYLFRRSRGTILVAMIAHGTWDISTFLTGSHGAPWIPMVTLVFLPVGLILGIAALVSIWRIDRNTVVTPSGIEQTPRS